MKAILFLIAILLFSNHLFCQDTTVVYSPNVSVKQDMKIVELMEKYREYNVTKEFTEGYRIQITYSNIREDIYREKGAMYKEFPQLASYVEYEQPSYKLRLGDFKTRLEASYYLQQIIAAHPGVFIVRDKIKLR